MYLRCSVQESPKAWKSWLPLAEIWYNITYHNSIGCSPFKALYGYDPNLGTSIDIPAVTPTSVTDMIEHRELHFQMLKEKLEQAQNTMKLFADKKRTSVEYSVGDQVLLKLQPYSQSSIANRPYPKLANKFFGPYKVLEKIGTVAYRLELPTDSQIHSVFHVSQLKPFHQDYTPVFSKLPVLTDIQATAAQPSQILERRLVHKGNNAITQILVTWTGLPASLATWEDYNVLRQRFPEAPAWGQAGSSAGGVVIPLAK